MPQLFDRILGSSNITSALGSSTFQQTPPEGVLGQFLELLPTAWMHRCCDVILQLQ